VIIPNSQKILEVGWPIESFEGCKTFELSWARYAAYLVTEELVGSSGLYDDEVYSVELEHHAFLDWIDEFLLLSGPKDFPFETSP
jgi:hypothetical protein